MELDDFFGSKQQDRQFDSNSRYQGSPSQAQPVGHPYHRYNSNYKWEYFLENLKSNRKLKGIVIFSLIVFLAIVIALIAILQPLIIKIINYMSQNGVQGLLDIVSGFLDKLWKGTAK